jgi:hypothetical protein
MGGGGARQRARQGGVCGDGGVRGFTTSSNACTVSKGSGCFVVTRWLESTECMFSSMERHSSVPHSPHVGYREAGG